MQKLLLTIGIPAAMTAGAFAQGTFVFENAGSSVNAPITVTTPGGSQLIPTGTAYTVGFYFSTTNTLRDGLLSTLATSIDASPATVNPSLAAGYFFGGTTTMRFIGGGTAVYIQPVVYTTSAGSLTAAEITAGDEFGIFAPVLVTLETGVTPPNQLTGLAPITVTNFPIPEPPTIALGGLGAAALLLLRRRP